MRTLIPHKIVERCNSEGKEYINADRIIMGRINPNVKFILGGLNG